MTKRTKLIIVIASVAVLAAVGGVILWSPAQNNVNSAVQFKFTSPKVETRQLELPPSSDSVYKIPCSPDELLVAVKPMIESVRVKQDLVNKELRDSKNQNHRDSLFLANRFESLCQSMIEFCDIHLNEMFLTQYSADTIADKLLGIQNELHKVGVDVWSTGECIYLQTSASLEYEFYKEFVSPKYEKYLEMLVFDRQERLPPIVSDACVMLSLDQLFNRIERCLAVRRLYDSGDALYARLTADIEQYTKFLLFCDMDNSLTFDSETKKIDKTIYQKLKTIENDSIYQHMEGVKLVKRYLTAIEANDTSYSAEIERNIMNYASEIFRNSN